MTEGREEQLRRLAGELQKAFEIKWDIRGAAKHLCKATTLPNRIVEWRQDGISWEPDPRQLELIVCDLGLENGKKAVTPGLRYHSKRRPQDDVAVDNIWVKATDKIGYVLVQRGGRVRVRGHGAAQVLEVDKEHKKDKVHVEYGDRTQYWCHASQVESESERKVCPECKEAHKFGEAAHVPGSCGPGGWAARQESGKQDFGLHSFENRMKGDGWHHVEGDRWARSVAGARSFPYPKVGQVIRRKVHDGKSGHMLEDLWMDPRTSRRRRKDMVLREPSDLVVEVDVCEDEKEYVAEDETPLEGQEATSFRATTARIHFLSADRADLQFCSKEASRCMARPTKGDLLILKRIGRCPIHKKRMAHLHRWQMPSQSISIYVASNWGRVLNDPNVHNRNGHHAWGTLTEDDLTHAEQYCSQLRRGGAVRDGSWRLRGTCY